MKCFKPLYLSRACEKQSCAMLRWFMCNIGHILLVQCQSNADLASSIAWRQLHNIIYACSFTKVYYFRCERRPCCHLPPGGSCCSHSLYVWPFRPFTKLTYAIRPLSPCHHVCFTTLCNWITWNLSDWVSTYVLATCKLWFVDSYPILPWAVVSTERFNTMLASSKELLWHKHSGHPIPAEGAAQTGIYWRFGKTCGPMDLYSWYPWRWNP